MRKKTSEIETVLGYKDYDEVVHRDNLVVIGND
jgi:glutamate 5-kinase